MRSNIPARIFRPASLLPALLLSSLLCGETAVLLAAEPTAEIEFFEAKIRPLIANRCLECHSDGAAKGGLVLETREAVLKGGDSGAAIVAGSPDESLLMEAVRHEAGLEMPPKQKLSDREIADLATWIKAGAVWPQINVSIPLGNLFDDAADVPLGDALHTDTFRADADADDLAVDRVAQGWGASATEIAPGVKFDFSNVGGDNRSHGQITNDGWSADGGIRTKGQKMPDNSDKVEDGIGMHANALITFDLAELRKAGGLSPEQAFRFVSERAGLNDCVFGTGGANAHCMVLIVRKESDQATPVIAGWINGTAVEITSGDVARFTGQIPAPLLADGKYAAFDIPFPGSATHLVLVTTGAGLGGGENTISSDHTVFSGARLLFDTESSRLAKLGRTDGPSHYVISDEQRSFWSFQPVQNPPLPAVKNPGWAQKPLDHFILAELERHNLQPVPLADRKTLIRRATFDLLGLPPTPAEVEQFLNDPDPQAYASLIDRLLSSPHYGERWGRHWLDVARYAEDQAHTFQARMYPQGYQYRDWVVAAFNRDLPYDQFVLQQIAGDLLPKDPEHEYDHFKSLGFFALGPVYYSDAGCAAKAALDELDDRIDTLGRGFLGLTVACARCHDHKFDPIPQTDYYALGGIFSSSQYREVPLVTQAEVESYNAGQESIKTAEKHLQDELKVVGQRRSEAFAEDLAKLFVASWKASGKADEGKRRMSENAMDSGVPDFVFRRWHKELWSDEARKLEVLAPWFELDKQFSEAAPEERSSEETLKKVEELAQSLQQQVREIQSDWNTQQKQHTEQLAAASEEEKKKIPAPQQPPAQTAIRNALFGDKGWLILPADKVESLLADADKASIKELKDGVEAIKKSAPSKYPVAHSLTEGNAADMPLYLRGNPAKKGSTVPRGFLSVLSGPEPVPFQEGSGRLELARAIASPSNPLTARVMVNRVWQQHFGRGIVGTPSNFGNLGERPSHPDLLDHLASKFMMDGWSIKNLHREIMLSTTYQLSSQNSAQNQESDADNRWYWRMNRRRLDVESWRDAVLSVAGNLDPTIGGPSGDLSNSSYVRRTMYAKVSRHNLDPLLRLFDFPDPNITSEKRTVTTVPLQQLFVLNGEWMVRQAKQLAQRLTAQPDRSPADQIREAFLLMYSRSPTEQELELGLAFLALPPLMDEEGKPLPSQLSPWEQYAQILLSANEFMFID